MRLQALRNIIRLADVSEFAAGSGGVVPEQYVNTCADRFDTG